VAGLDDLQFYATPRLAPDELTIYFTTLSPIDGSLQADLVSAVRATRDAPFDRPALLTAFNTTASDNDPTVGADLEGLWFSSTRTGNAELYVARRATPTAPFGAPALVPGLSSPAQEMHPYYRNAGPELWFTSDRDDAGVDIYVAPLQAGSFGPATVVKELSSTAGEAHIYVSEDGRHALLASTRDGGAGGWDLWVATRGAPSERFAQPTPLAEVNTTSDEYGGWISPDGCRVYFSSNRDTEAAPRHRIWSAERAR
jgi:hypothetical protein